MSHELDFVLSETLECLKRNDIVGATQMIDAAIGYKQLEDSNDWVFKMVKEFVLIDDEPINETTEKHNKLKAEVYKNYQVSRFFFAKFTWL